MNNQKLRDLTRNNKSAVANIQDLPQQRNGAFGRSDDKTAQASSLVNRLPSSRRARLIGRLTI